jgi:hypothetical protein
MSINTYATLVNQKVIVPSARTNYVAVDKDHLVDFLKPFLKSIHFDAGWYVRAYPDISQAISDGIVRTAADHYLAFGYYEHRMPYEINVDQPWYLSQYPDVDDAVAKGLFASAYEHYYLVGFREGRLPYANFTLKVNGAG